MKLPVFLKFSATFVLTSTPLAPAPPKKTGAAHPCALGRRGTSGRRLFYAATLLPDIFLRQCNANNRALFTLVAAILRTLGRIGRLCLTPIQCPAPRSLFWPEPFGARSGQIGQNRREGVAGCVMFPVLQPEIPVGRAHWFCKVFYRLVFFLGSVRVL